eukprot:SAG31_NODE_5341_length_2599_cov_1.845600_4_plen_162_part_00
MGIARLLTCIAEVPAFRMSGQILKLLGVSGSFALAQVAYIVRFLYYVNLRAIAKLGPWGMWAVLPIELLHGVTFAVNWSALSMQCVSLSCLSCSRSLCGRASFFHLPALFLSLLFVCCCGARVFLCESTASPFQTSLRWHPPLAPCPVCATQCVALCTYGV